MFLTRTFKVSWSIMCIYNVRLIWVAGWNKKFQSSGRGIEKSGIIVLERGGTIPSLFTKSCLFRNWLFYLVLMGMVTLQLSTTIWPILRLSIKPLGARILFFISIYLLEDYWLGRVYIWTRRRLVGLPSFYLVRIRRPLQIGQTCVSKFLFL